MMLIEDRERYELARDEFDADLRHHLAWVEEQFGKPQSHERAAQIAKALTCLVDHNDVVCASG